MIDVVEMVIKQPGQVDRVVRLQDGATRLGRAEDNEVVLSDVGVSRRHAQVYVSRSEVTVEDLGSGNGTYYNGYRVNSQPLTHGDEIVIDPFVLQFRIQTPGAPQPAPMVPAPADPDGPRLEVVVGAGMVGAVFPITARGLSIGRSEDRDVVIPDPAASRHHCQLSLQGEGVTLRDMGSANGVYVNAVRVRECALADGDLVRIGNTEMRFGHPGQPARSSIPAASRWNGPPGGSQSRPPRRGVPTQQFPQPDVGAAGPSRMMMAAVIGVVLFVGLIGAGVVATAVGLFVYQQRAPTEITNYEPQAPRWILDLPQGLPPARIVDLFEEGRAKMAESQPREGLQNFYRILNTEPGRVGVSQLAAGAGEAMVLDTLAKDFARRVEDRTRMEKERAWLLGRATSTRHSASRRQKAVDLMREGYTSDPVVLAAAQENGWFEASEDYVALQQKAADGQALLRDDKIAEAAPLLLEVVLEGTNPDVRTAALEGLLRANHALAGAARKTWAEAVVLEASGQHGEAKARFRELETTYPTLPSATAHLQR